MSIKSAESVRTERTESFPAESQAGSEATQEAVKQAREVATRAISKMHAMSGFRQVYMACLFIAVACTLVFDMATFSVATPGVAVSETVAQAQRDAEAKLNSWSYSAFTSSLWGKLAWLSALSGIGIAIASAIGWLRTGWGPLAEVGCAAMATVLFLLLFFVGFPDLSAYGDASCSATLLGYWIPLLAAGIATFAAVKPILEAA